MLQKHAQTTQSILENITIDIQGCKHVFLSFFSNLEFKKFFLEYRNDTIMSLT